MLPLDDIECLLRDGHTSKLCNEFAQLVLSASEFDQLRDDLAGCCGSSGRKAFCLSDLKHDLGLLSA
jgi:hypothetical protein